MRLSAVEYKKRKAAVIKQLDLTEAEYTELIKGDYHDGAGKVASTNFINAISSGESTGLLSGYILDDWDFVWYYKRNLHVILPEVESYSFDISGIDFSAFENMDKDIDIDTILPTKHGHKVSFIRCIKRNIPIHFKSSSCDCTIEVNHEDGSQLRFHFAISNQVRKVFLEGISNCANCDKCTRMKSTDNFPHILRPRFREECKVQDKFSEPFGIMSIVAQVIKVYQNREKLVRAKKSTPETESMRAIMVASSDIDKDTERVMPLFDYVHEYHESVRQEWKGGHHASPVSHPRSGYWRKAKHGTHILSNGEFVEVGKGLGKYIFVNPTIVNAHKDSVLSLMVDGDSN